MLISMAKCRSASCFLAVIAVLYLGLACGKSGGSSSGDKVLGDKAYQILADEGLTGTDQEVKGTGTVLFKDPLGETGGEKSVGLDFRLDDGGSLTLATYADTSLKNGVRVTFLRNGSTLSAIIEVGSQKSDPRILSSVDASGLITLDIDVHNGETPVHVMVWNRGVSSYTQSTTVLDTDVGQSILGNGTAAFWGITMAKATLTKTVVTEAKFAD
jgi:hypothetical protein